MLSGPPLEPDLSEPWNRNVWFYGLRLPFSFVLLGWITFAQALAPTFDFEIYLYTLLASIFGLVIGAHYIDIATSEKKFSPYLRLPGTRMLYTGIVFIGLGALVGAYISLRWNPLFLIFVVIETFAAVAYPRERPRFAHSYTGFALTWGSIPFLAAYFIQAGTLSLVLIAASIFVGLSTLMMHHLAIMTRESRDWQNAMYLLALYRYAVYLVGLLALVGRLAVI